MSTPPAAGPHDGERRKSLGKYVKRMSSVFKREKSSKNVPQTSSAAAPAAPAASGLDRQQSQSQGVVPREEAATQEGAQEPAKAQSIRQEHPTEEPAAAPVTAAADLTPTTTEQLPAPVPVNFTPVSDRNVMQLERARELFAKYGLTFESDDLFRTGASAPLVPRVEKAIRMRVHRSCHKCGTLYGHDKNCVQCDHKRCKQCPRYPKKKTAGEKKEKEASEQPKKKKVLTLTTRNGNELAYQPATQRVRRTCHKCGALCTKCPREPAKRNKWPSGYPGDVAADSEDDVEEEKQLEQFRRVWRKPRRICTRSPVKKPRQEESFDPAVVAAVEAKLRALGVDSDPPTSEPEHV
ncbi:hypothetical protein E8E11_003680 [Didymella keratinophila]|nr:hypothetical protein E8E11_003680 [Didymella keratinophila]